MTQIPYLYIFNLMVEYTNEDKLDLVFHALADATRRSLLQKVKESPKRVTDLAAEYSISLNAVSKHLKVLEKAELIQRKVSGRVHYCEANPIELERVQKWIDHYTSFWNQRLDQLENFVSNKKEKE